MSDGISFRSICCNDVDMQHIDVYMQHKEGDFLIIKYTHKEVGDYDSRIPVYTCEKCKKKWAVERVV